MIHTRQHVRREHFAVCRDPAHRYAAETDAVIALLAADQARALGLAAHPVIPDRDLERRVHRLGARIHEERVINAPGSELLQASGEFKGGRMA